MPIEDLEPILPWGRKNLFIVKKKVSRLDLFLDRFSIDEILNWPANYCGTLFDGAPFVIGLLDAGVSIDSLLELSHNELYSFVHECRRGVLVLLKNKQEFKELLKLAQKKAPIVRYSETTMKALLDAGLSLQQILDLPKDLQEDFTGSIILQTLLMQGYQLVDY